MKTKINVNRILMIFGACVCVAGLVYAGYLFWNLNRENILLGDDMRSLEQSFGITKTNLENIRRENFNLTDLLEHERGVSDNLSKNLENQVSKNIALETQVVNISGMVQDISGTVGTLEKLSQTDKELLMKYSKIYFLSENYVPSRLTTIGNAYLLDESVPKQIHAGVDPFLVSMLSAAMDAEIDLRIASAYRSFYNQESLKSGYKVLYGSGANQFSADQGYSEHQLGTTVDFTTEKLGALSTSFDKSSSYAWLSENAYRFGFILSYPKGNVYYQYEPWHWRFVGVQLATKLHQEEKSFYDLSQREIDTYLVSVFDR